MASWGDIELARTWSRRSRRAERVRIAGHRSTGEAAEPVPASDRPASVGEGLTASHEPSRRLVAPVGGEPAAARRPLRADGVAPLRVLIADDNASFTELLFRLLAGHDWIEIVGCAANGRDAVVLASATTPDLVLMDLDMPVMGGVEAMRQIRRRAAVPVLVVTASALPEDRERALAEGALAVLSKTIDPAELIGHIQNVFLGHAA